MLAEADRANGCTTPIPTIPPTDPDDTRKQVADLFLAKDPAKPAYYCGPAFRAGGARRAPKGGMGTREAIGETDFEPQQILGYAPIEPDGSFQIQVPGDAAGRGRDRRSRPRFQTHTNWIQVRPGETRTCDGCHSPRRGRAQLLDHQDTVPAALTSSFPRSSGETMAQTRTNNVAGLLSLSMDLAYSDVWADPPRPAAASAPASRSATPATPRPTASPTRPTTWPPRCPPRASSTTPTIQPLWSRDRAPTPAPAATTVPPSSTSAAPGRHGRWCPTRG